MKKLLIKIFSKVIKFFVFLFFLLPKKVQWFCGDLLGLLWFDVLRIRRDVVLDNIGKAFPKLSHKDKIKIARQSLKFMGRGFVEFSWFPFLNKKNIDHYVTLKGTEHLSKALEGGKGVALLTLHLGNGDLATAGASLNGFPMVLISKVFKVQWLNELWFGMRGRLGTEFIPPRNSSYSVLKALKKNKVVIFVQDQFMGPPVGVKTSFFGIETGTGAGLATMVQRSKSPVIPCYIYRNERGKTIVVFEEEIPFEQFETKEETIQNMTQKYNDKLEEYVRHYPEQWMWLHKRWKKYIVH